MVNKKIFISFAIEDICRRDTLLEEAKKEVPNYEFISVVSPWKHDWKSQYHALIGDIDCVFFIFTLNTKHAEGQLWEIKHAKELSIPVFGLIDNSDDEYLMNLPKELGCVQVIEWNWECIKECLYSL